jgi:hypothetical protein
MSTDDPQLHEGAPISDRRTSTSKVVRIRSRIGLNDERIKGIKEIAGICWNNFKYILMYDGNDEKYQWQSRKPKNTNGGLAPIETAEERAARIAKEKDEERLKRLRKAQEKLDAQEERRQRQTEWLEKDLPAQIQNERLFPERALEAIAHSEATDMIAAANGAPRDRGIYYNVPAGAR